MAADPVLTVVVTVVSDTAEQSDTCHLEGCLEALQHQIDPPPMEVLVTCDSQLPGIQELERRFPHVCFICVDTLRTVRSGHTREHHDKLRGIGIQRARAPLVALIEDHSRPDVHWSAALIKEHAQSRAAIGGAIENGIDRALNWAVYFSDFGRYQNPVRRGPSTYLSDANVCYKRAALEQVAEAWSGGYDEARVHAALTRRGETLALSPDVIVYQHRLGLRLATALVERYVWGRSFGAGRTALIAPWQRALYAVLCPLLPPILFLRQLRNVLRTGRNRAAFLRAAPLTALLDVAWSCGECVGYLTGHP
ncbi:MAG: hypothetical protein LAN37_00200 [Acidobacteriia bacterium]|nr:hypothetical protein [Terriglobia bacterium]